MLIARIRKKSKRHLNWEGPLQLVSTKSDYVMVLKDPRDGSLQDVHVRRILGFCAASEGSRAQLISEGMRKKDEWEGKKIVG